MGKLLKLQLRNIFQSKEYYICGALTFVLSPLLLASALLLLFNVGDAGGFEFFSQLDTFLYGEIGIASTIFIVIVCCMDYNNQTTKNIIARGYTRMQLLISKILSLIISIFVVYAVSTIIIFLTFSSNGIGFNTNIGLQIIIDIVKIITFIVLYSTVSMLLEKTSTSILVCLLGPSLITTLLGIIDTKLNIEISKYWIDNLAKIFNDSISLKSFGLTILYFVIYIVITLLIGKKLLDKKEIK